MKTTNLGFSNAHKLIIKKTVEGFWKGKNSQEEVKNALLEVENYNYAAQKSLDLKPVFDIDVYDRLLKTAVIFGLVSKRFGTASQALQDLNLYFSIARGNKEAAASPMVKWFNTNYHVIQPEIESDPCLIEHPPLPVLKEDQKLCLIGPWTLLSYAINKTATSLEELFEKLAQQYISFINLLPHNSIVQLEEPSFILKGIPKAYSKFCEKLSHEIHLHVYFGAANHLKNDLFSLSVKGIGLDFIDGPENLNLLKEFPKNKTLIAGIINGRNVWPATEKTKEILAEIANIIPQNQLYLSPSCSLMHLPISAKEEKSKFSFALEKLEELEQIKQGTIKYQKSNKTTEDLPLIRFQRSRKSFWISSIPYPTSTIGSFPQTVELREKRKKYQNKEIPAKTYESYIKKYIKECVKKQEKLGLDVLVHGEPERSDMVEFFAENLKGMKKIKGWVQSYGTRYIRPPIIAGHVTRPHPFTVKWSIYAQSLSKKPVKGMLTGPVTLTKWSYPREDISKEAQFYDIAKALKKEVNDLVEAGITHIQIDEPAIREALPLDRAKWNHYLHHAANAFRFIFSDVPDNVVIYSHICFSEFSDIMDTIQDLGMDVLSIEDSKSKGKVARTIKDSGFNGSIGLGVFDVHSPRVPNVEEIMEIPKSLTNLDRRRIWINPDCGLKTRGEEAYKQLAQMMKAVRILRKEAQVSR